MVTRHVRGKITWIDLECPTEEELGAVMREFGIDPRIEEEIISPTSYPIVIGFPRYVYLILHFPTGDPKGGTKSQEVDFIVGKHFIITARYELIDSIHGLHKVFEAEELLGLPKDEVHAGILIERIFRRLYGAIRDEINQVGYVLERIERDIFDGKERQMVRTISDVGRVLLRFETTLERHAEPLEEFLSYLSSPEYFGKEFAEEAAHITAERDHAAGLVASYNSVARELRMTNDSLLTASQNEVMKNLTIMAFTTFPLTLLSSLFAIEAKSVPIIGMPGDFWIILGIMTVLAFCFFLFFRYKKWL